MSANLERIVDGLAARAQPGEGVEGWAEQITETSVRAFEGEIENLTSASSEGVGVRVVAGGRLGYAYTADTSEAGVADCLAEARANLDVASEDEGNVLPEARPFEPLEEIFDRRLVEADPRRKVAFALDLEERVKAVDPRVRKVETAAYGDVVSRLAVASSTGVRGAYARTRAWAYAIALATDGDETQMGIGEDAGRCLEDLDPRLIAHDAAERAARMLGARKPATRTVPVLFDWQASRSLLGVLVAGLSAEAVQKRRSLFAGKLGERVGAPGLRLVDDGRLVAGGGAAPFDGEGVPTRRLLPIDDGVLRELLHNTATATRDRVASTGNASRGSFKATPGVAPHCVHLAPGDQGPDALLARMGEGLLVQDVAGVHSGANPVTGDFSVGVNGHWVRGGEPAEPVREATVAAHLLDILRGIVAVGSDLRFTTGSLGGSSLLVGEMTVAGT
ncbi:MAG TPA: TldD/PmbA family protein [Actinomycetes bacterium]|nr:TldD/PmbA family protein [Actinomycetes bacterium]